MELLAASGADLLACETIPSLAEAEALLRLLDEVRAPAWLSMSCRDGEHVNHGEPLREVAALAERSPWVVAFGVNCTAPRHVESLLAEAAQECSKPLLCYPNSGEHWDGAARCWLPGTGEDDFGAAARRWVAAGARLVGGCCRTTPADIRAVRGEVQG
jgi:homocysteine S-methyltransferase